MCVNLRITLVRWCSRGVFQLQPTPGAHRSADSTPAGVPVTTSASAVRRTVATTRESVSSLATNSRDCLPITRSQTTDSVDSAIRSAATHAPDRSVLIVSVMCLSLYRHLYRSRITSRSCCLPFLLQDWLHGFPGCLLILLSTSVFLLSVEHLGYGLGWAQ